MNEKNGVIAEFTDLFGEKISISKEQMVFPKEKESCTTMMSIKGKAELFSNPFSSLLPLKKITKPIRLIELFGGVGAQSRALENLGVPFEHWRLIEWSDKSIVQYNSIHEKDFSDYSQGKSREEMEKRIFGISCDYSNPMTKEQISKKPLDWVKKVYNAAIATKDLIDVSSVKGSDLGITETGKYEYIITYSFPCQDLSNAGKMAGILKGTRSGLLWQVERILSELKECDSELPQTLLMENVPGLLGDRFLPDFSKWVEKLESLGYRNYIKTLNANDFGIPQSRKRVFMVSVLGDFNYVFPEPIGLNHCLKDFLEKEVDESYYLSEEQIKRILSWKSRVNPLEGIKDEKKICPALLSMDSASPAVVFQINQLGNILPNLINKKVNGKEPKIQDRVYATETITPVLTVSFPPSYLVDLSIRKLTPKEYCRLMGFNDYDYASFQKVGSSNSAIYHCMGDSIVVTVLMAIFGKLLLGDNEIERLMKSSIEKSRGLNDER
jgi:DNA (cytosine-5)-methyltransferase 1